MEGRFGQYRQMSGGNYNISVTQVLESEKRLKILNYLSLKSSLKGSFHITQLNHSSSTDTDFEKSATTNFECANNIFQAIHLEELSESDSNVLIFVSGYVAHIVKKKVLCRTCVCRLSLDSHLDSEFLENTSEYLKLVDRGGLKWPSPFTLSVCTDMFKMFKITIEYYEEALLTCTNQRKMLIDMGTEHLSHIFDLEELCPCGRSVRSIVEHCLRCIINILLNNYSKVKNNSLIVKKNAKRKLSTLN